jgi:hypothetical protein
MADTERSSQQLALPPLQRGSLPRGDLDIPMPAGAKPPPDAATKSDG